MWEVKKISRFLSMGHGILPHCSCKACETIVSKCKLTGTLWGLAATVAFFANEARFTQI